MRTIAVTFTAQRTGGQAARGTRERCFVFSRREPRLEPDRDPVTLSAGEAPDDNAGSNRMTRFRKGNGHDRPGIDGSIRPGTEPVIGEINEAQHETLAEVLARGAVGGGNTGQGPTIRASAFEAHR